MGDELTLKLPLSEGRTVSTGIPGTGRWWDKIGKTEHGWPLVICFDTKADRDAISKEFRADQ